MRTKIYRFISIALLISLLTSCSAAGDGNRNFAGSSSAGSSKRSPAQTVTDPLRFITREDEKTVAPDINLIIIDSNGKTVGRTKTGKDGNADITVTVPTDKRYGSAIGTVTVIAYNNEKYVRTILLEVPVAGGGVMNQDIIMQPKTGYRDEEVNICYGNIYHMYSMDMADQYVPWNG